MTKLMKDALTVGQRVRDGLCVIFLPLFGDFPTNPMFIGVPVSSESNIRYSV